MVSNLQISKKLMSKSECNAAVVPLLNSTGYVCQGQEILLATAEFKLDRDSQNKLTTGADITPDKVNDALKTAIETQSDQSVVERDGRLYSGSALNYGVEFYPTCLAPSGARFARVLPRNSFGPLHQLCHLPHPRSCGCPQRATSQWTSRKAPAPKRDDRARWRRCIFEAIYRRLKKSHCRAVNWRIWR